MRDAEAIRPLGVYIHVPFCRVHCPYCDFYTYPADRGRQDDFVAALLAEIGLIPTRLDPRWYRVETIYFGGGTPALLPTSAIRLIIDKIQDELLCAPVLELTLEANPREVTPDYLEAVSVAGVNRLSIGIQSFNDALLARLGRDHTGADSERALGCVAHWKNWSADLIFGSSGHDERSLEADLDRLLKFSPPHVSLYQLTIEPQTRFGSLARRGMNLVTDENSQADQYELVCNRLADAGFEHYEVSNFARPNFRAQHNAAYWKRIEYIGLGPSASSMIAERRTQNLKSLPQYVDRLRHNLSATVRMEVLSPQEILNERIWLGLRTSDGIDRTLLCGQAQKWIPEGIGAGLLVDRSDGTIRLTQRGMALADSVSGRLLLTESV